MLKKVYENFRKGIEKLKWFATLFSERMNIEIAVFKLLYQSDEMAEEERGLSQNDRRTGGRTEGTC